MNDLACRYLGHNLKSPLVASASPLTGDLDSVRRLEDAGVSAVTLESIFQEEIDAPAKDSKRGYIHGLEATAVEALSTEAGPTDPESHLKFVEAICRTTEIPVFASLNITTPGPWLEYCRALEGTGVGGIELNLYTLPASGLKSGDEIEKHTQSIVAAVRKETSLPIAVKITPYYSSLRHFCAQLCESGAQALVLFNRFYQPDIDLKTLQIIPHLVLSNSFESRLGLRWMAILHGRMQADLAASTGIHTSEDALKSIAAGANITMLCAVLLREGLGAVERIENEMKAWLNDSEFESISGLHGALSQINCTDPELVERTHYLRMLRQYR